MRSIERKFNYIRREHPSWSTWTCFTKAIHGRNFSKDKIKRWFNELVDKNDYEEKDKMKLLKYLYEINKDIA